MKHLRKFNENESFKNPDDAIREFFIDYIDDDSESLHITNGWVKDDNFIWDIDYIKKIDLNKYRKAKLINLRISKSDGISLGPEARCLTSLIPLKKAIQDIERFYELSDEEVNYTINTSDEFLQVSFVVKGGNVDDSESYADIIDDLLLELKGILALRGYKRITAKDNFLDIRIPIKEKVKPWALALFLRRVGNGEEPTKENDRMVYQWVRKITDAGFSLKSNAYDGQVVVNINKI
jgi:hypothetical protein